MATIPRVSAALYAAAAGAPTSVLRLGTLPLPASAPGPPQVLLRMLAAPVNPSDINAVQGVYPVPLADIGACTTAGDAIAGVPGFEGVAQVVALGESAATETHADLVSAADTAAGNTTLQVGDWVLPSASSAGTWRSHLVAPVTDLLRVPAAIGAAAAASLSVNPSTAYRMLADFADLQPGDVVVQNGGNSAVGQYVSQICRIRQIECVSVVRDREDFDHLADRLLGLGATHVVRPTELRAFVDGKKASGAWRPGAVKLALNTVGGRSATDLVRAVDDAGTVATYGGMSRDPIAVPTASFIFKDVRMRGFWMTRWKQNAAPGQRRIMIDELVAWYRQGLLATPEFELVSIPSDPSRITPETEAAIVAAVSRAGAGFAGKKQMLVFE